MPTNSEHLDLSKKSSWLLLAIVIVVGILLFSAYINAQTEAIQGRDQKSLIDLRKALLSDTESIHTQWLKTLNPLVKKTEGSLVWQTKKQLGVMTFINLPAISNNQQYHLWIYDLKRKQGKPIYGGFFTKATNKNKDKEVLFSITVEEKIMQPYKFLITLENTKNEDKKVYQTLLLAQP